MDPILVYLLIINALGLTIMLVDKHNAINGLSRIPERGLWAVACLGGSLGCALGMYLFRHKTRKGVFPWGMPLILLAQLLLLIFLKLKN